MGVNEFVEGMLQGLSKRLYEAIYPLCEYFFDALFTMMDKRVAASYNDLKVSVDEWNPTIFTLIQDIVVKNVAIPIAACFITFIFCLELIHIMQDGNQLRNIKPETVLFVFIKFALCALICSKSFEIVTGLQDVGIWAVKKLGSQTVGTLDGHLQLNALLPQTPDEYTIKLVLILVGDMLLLSLSFVITCVMSVMVMTCITMWYMEFLIYASVAPIPFSTFDNKEWSQVGMNYLRKMLALAFQGFFMMLIVVIYSYAISSIEASDDFIDMLTKLLGSGVVLCMLLHKAGNISASVFNAH